MVRAVERAGAPAEISEVDVAVLVEELERLADVLDARFVVAAAADFRQEGHTAILLQPIGERFESGVDGVAHAGGMCAGVVGIEVLVDVKDEVIVRTVRVLDF